MRTEDVPRWWSMRPAQNRKPATYRCPLCGGHLPALSEHFLIAPEGDASRRRHAHTSCALAARRAGRLPTRDEWRRDQYDPAVTSLAEQAVDAVGGRDGRHPGYRALHAKGIFCRGTFTATPEAAGLTRAGHMQGETVEALVRFSNGNGDPGKPDYARDGRGMAVKFSLPDGSDTDIVSLTLPRFFVRTPEDFLSMIRAGTGSAAAVKVPLFLATHLQALPALRAFLALQPPASYATCRYNGIHAFRWIDGEGTVRHVRYSWLPEAGEESISKTDAKERGADYLREEIGERLAREPAHFALQLQIAAEGDRVDDATAVWPDDRETVVAGTLELTGLDPSREQGGEVVVFDPVRVTDGIEPSADPLIQFRSDAYSVSIERRAH